MDGSSLSCEGIIGDGCGGGRIFFIEDNSLNVYDPTTNQTMLLYTPLKNAKSLTKQGCILTIQSNKNSLKFDISTLKITS